MVLVSTTFGKKNAVILSVEFCYFFQEKRNIKETIFSTAREEKGSIEIGSLLRMTSYAYASICVLLYS